MLQSEGLFRQHPVWATAPPGHQAQALEVWTPPFFEEERVLGKSADTVRRRRGGGGGGAGREAERGGENGAA